MMHKSHQRQPQRQQQAQAQQAFIVCDPDRAILPGLVDEVEGVLAGQGATILRYGVSPMRHDGFIVVEAARGIPPTFYRWLRADSRVVDYVVYDVPSYEQERAIIQEQAAAWYAHTWEQPPALPIGYTLLAEPINVDEPSDEIAAARVQSDEFDEGEGLLLYCVAQELLFLMADEAINLTAYLLEQGRPMLAACSERYREAPQHRERLEIVTRALAAAEPKPLLSEEEQRAAASSQEPPASVQRLLDWIDRHPYRLVPDEEIGGFRLVPDNEQVNEDEEAQQ